MLKIIFLSCLLPSPLRACYTKLLKYDFNDLCASLKALKASSESVLPENEKKDSLLGVYWAAQMASTYASAACNAR